eukprot:TRINITY_DN14909_c0_g1_i1.p1 TRINITY_DN14909_c0_g1~~TRINITY_DN14909_c0_g1_i1.p1  ORF type:complete len:718 (+),score=201.53 TRINITY_DN14909_c0_g1_i1:97-2250(+)
MATRPPQNSSHKRGLQEVSTNTPTKSNKREKLAVTPSVLTPVSLTPRFSTTFKTHADKSYSEGVHKSRCPCIVIKELTRELKELDKKKDMAKIRKLEIKIAELKAKGCSHGNSKTVTREEILVNKMKVDSHTIHGKHKMLKELERAHMDARRKILEEEDTLRSELSVDLQIGTSAVRKMLAVREDFRTEESMSRRKIENEGVGPFFQTAVKEFLHNSQRNVLEQTESRKRKRVHDEEQDATNGIRVFTDFAHRLVRVVENEAGTRTAIHTEQTQTRLVVVNRNYSLLFNSLELNETATRGVFLKGEETSFKTLLQTEKHDAEQCGIISEEVTARRVYAAEEHYDATELFSSASWQKLHSVTLTETTAREAVILDESIAFSSLLLSTGEEIKRSGIAYQYYGMLVKMHNMFTEDEVTALVDTEERFHDEIKIEEKTSRRSLETGFVAHGSLVLLEQEERQARQCVARKYLDGLANLEIASQENIVLNLLLVEDIAREQVHEEEVMDRGLLEQEIAGMKLDCDELCCRANIDKEQEAEIHAIMSDCKESASQIFECLENFRTSRQYFNSKENLFNLPQWNVTHDMELRCATNPLLLSLLRHSLSLNLATEQHFNEIGNRNESDFGKQHSELVQARGELSRTKDTLKELEQAHRISSTDLLKEKAANKTLKAKVANLDKEMRSTQVANERAKHEKRTRDLEVKLAAMQKALDKERVKNRK